MNKQIVVLFFFHDRVYYDPKTISCLKRFKICCNAAVRAFFLTVFFMNRLLCFLIWWCPLAAYAHPTTGLPRPAAYAKVDTLPPAVNCPASVTITLPVGKCDTAFRYTVAAYDDLPGYTLTQTAGLASGAPFPVGTTLNQYLVTDSEAQTATCSFSVTIHAAPMPLNCKTSLSINLGNTCSLTMTALQAMENSSSSCENAFRIQILRNGIYVPANLGQKDIGKTLMFRIDRLDNGAMCTGNVTVRDNVAPTLTCRHISVSCAIPNPTPNYLADSLNIADARPLVTDNCYSKVRLTFADSYTPGVCDTIGDTVGNIFRTWQATDSSGNGVTCRQRIRLFSVFNGINFPEDTILECTNANTLPGSTGRPYILANNRRIPLSEGTTCDVGIAFTDNTQSTCGNTYRMLRNWLVVNWCKPNTPGNPVSYTQVIEVRDTTSPVLKCPPATTISAPAKDCKVNIDLPDITIRDDCSFAAGIKAYWEAGKGAMDSLSGTLMGFPGNLPGVKDTLGVLDTAFNFPTGSTIVRYVATDVCGNTGECTVAIQIWDQTPPKAVCKSTVTAWIGTAWNPENLDNGSLDDCNPLHFRVRRADSTNCHFTTSYNDALSFCCNDVGDTISVILRVYDVPLPGKSVAANFASGQWAACTAKILVLDTLPLRCTAPPDVSVRCDSFATNLSVYGNAETTCKTDTLYETVDRSGFREACKTGTLIRRFTVEDASGNSKSCTQRIVVGDQTDDYYVRFPDDVMVTNCQQQGNLGAPQFERINCENMSVTFVDDTLESQSQDVCFIIERTWRIRNLCHYDSTQALILVPNPAPVKPLESLDNRFGPIISPAGTASPWVPSLMKILPTDSAATNYSKFWQAGANGYEYVQRLTICCPRVKVTALGTIHTVKGKPVEEVAVTLHATHPSFPLIQSMNTLTNSQGAYLFPAAFPLGSNYEITPTKDENPLSGITTLDLALISRHILGLDTLDTPYQIIAADANRSNSVTTFDVVEFRKMILGIYDKLPANQSWRFVPENYVFPNPLTPFTPPFPEKVSATSTNQDTVTHPFIAIKVGDVNLSFNRSATTDRAPDTVFLHLPNRRMKAGDEFELEIKTIQDIIGLQFTLNLSPDIALMDLLPGQATTREHFEYFPQPTHALTMAWYNPVAAMPSVRLRLRAIKSGLLSEYLQLSNRITKVEGYLDGVDPQPLAVTFRYDNSSLPQTIEMYANRPNPFRDETSIGLFFPVTQKATFSVTDVTGRVLHQTQTVFRQGEHTIRLGDDVFGGKSGLYFYRIETEDTHLVRKMIRQ